MNKQSKAKTEVRSKARCPECGTSVITQSWQVYACLLAGHHPECDHFKVKDAFENIEGLLHELLWEIEKEAQQGDGISASMWPVYERTKHLLGDPMFTTGGGEPPRPPKRKALQFSPRAFFAGLITVSLAIIGIRALFLIGKAL